MNNSLENRIGVGSRVYHLTHEDNWRYIQENKAFGLTLTPNSKINDWLNTNGINASRDKFLFTVCGVKKNFADWKEYCLFDRLIEHIRRFGRDYGNIILLSFPMEKADSVFVANHAYLSPKMFKELCGENLFEIHLNHSDVLMWKKQCELYANSLIPLRDYKDFYGLPEIWYSHPVSIDKITVEEVLG